MYTLILGSLISSISRSCFYGSLGALPRLALSAFASFRPPMQPNLSSLCEPFLRFRQGANLFLSGREITSTRHLNQSDYVPVIGATCTEKISESKTIFGNKAAWYRQALLHLGYDKAALAK
jgi:hypothetical protein